MKTKNQRTALWILAVYLAATLALIVMGYSVQQPEIRQHEFPFSITYEYQGSTETIQAVYVAEYVKAPAVIGDSGLSWQGHLKDHNRLEADYIRIDETENTSFSINLHLNPGHLMGDPAHAHVQSAPEGHYFEYDGVNDIYITDPAQLAQLGIRILDWEYPTPIENSFSYGGISLSGETTAYSTVLAAAALLACVALVKKKSGLIYRPLDHIGSILNFLIVFLAAPVIFLVSGISQILDDGRFLHQVLYLTPALTLIGIAASTVLRRFGLKKTSFFIQFAGIALFLACCVILDL